ncbi:MAG: DUF4191 domain-containing protein [Propionibacteriaceae bacterium]|jgi:hypothetical protein|nr:DUF4191 domain-containing protein [Propionibacteriaceae bacterium]
MASERAKQLAADQKAAVKAEKQRRKSSEDPKDWGRMRQFGVAFKTTVEYDKAALPMIIASFVALTVIGVVLAIIFGVWMYAVSGVMCGLVAVMFILLWRLRVATFKRFEGQAGSGEIGLTFLGKAWIKDPVIAYDRYQNVVHRVVGPAGIVLVGDGQAGRVRELLATETKRHEAIKYSVPVTTIVMGEAHNQVPLQKLDKHIKRLPKVIKGRQINEVMARLKALDAARPKIPIPKGPMPTMKGARSALRGR